MGNFLKYFDDSDNCKMYMCSDLHLSHKRDFTWAKRGYFSKDAHTSGVINIINNTCRNIDILWCLGDFCLNTPEQQFFELVNRINCKLYFLNGNHYNPHWKLYLKHCKEKFKFDYEIYGYEWLNKITYWGQYYEFVWNKQPTILSHYPFAIWNQCHKNSIHLHGHCHANFAPGLQDTNEGKLLDVGWDQFAKPLSFKEIIKIMNKKSYKQKDHHDKSTN